MTASQFLTMFPEFSSYDPTRISFWLSVASNLINTAQWGALSNQGQALLTAHYLVIDAQNQNPSTQGQVNAPISSKSVDGVSLTKEIAQVVVEKAGQFNATSYGIQYYQLSRMMGAGAIQAIGEGFSWPLANVL